MHNKVREPLFHIVKRDTLPWYQAWGIRAIAIVLALLLCALITTLCTHLNPLKVFGTMFSGAFGSPRKIWILGQNLAILLCISLAVTPAFKMRFWNIGAEGQVLAGGLAAAACMICLGDKVPNGLLIVLIVLSGIAAGARPALGKETAVVLTDENLLLPLLYALPADIGRVNVTMGFPLRQSLAYTFVERLVELQNHRRRKGDGCTFYHADVAGILAHPYVAECDAALTRTMHEEIVRDRRISVDAAWLGRNELLKRIFTPAATWRELSDYMLDVVAAVARQPYEGDDARQRVEFLAVIAEQVTKLRNSLDECDIDLTAEVYTSLLRRHLQTLRIPFEGEPLEGIQIMGLSLIHI